MLDAGFGCLKSDPNLYRHQTKKLWALVYVDSLMFVGEQRDIDEVYNARFEESASDLADR